MTGNDYNDSASGVSGERIVVSDSRLAGSNYGLIAEGWARLTNTTVEQNFNAGVYVKDPWRQGGKLNIADSTIRDNAGEGVRYEVTSVKIARSTITGNGLSGVGRTYGIYSSCLRNKFVAVETAIVGNGVSGSCADPDVLCVDVDACVVPRLKNSSCDRSHVSTSGIPGDDWNVCFVD